MPARWATFHLGFKFRKKNRPREPDPARGVLRLSATPQYAELKINFNFDPRAADKRQVSGDSSADTAQCAQTGDSAIDENGTPVWLSSDDLMRRVIEKSELTFPMLGHGHLRGAVKIDARIDTRGNVACADAIDGHPIAIASAMAAIREWKFI